jgi:YegS/Rv2252/BmrU family lipid kinase
MCCTLAIVNPVAGNGSGARIWQRVRSEVDALRAWECVMTERAGHARELAHAACSSGYERVVAFGGDGTICEVANGLAHSDAALCIVPVGTGNDTSRNLRIPDDPLTAAGLAASAAPRLLDLGQIETAHTTAYFVNVAGFGFDAEVAWRVNRMPKLIGGTLPYLAGVVQTLWQFRAPRMRVSVDGKLVEGRVFLVAVANNPAYGGGMMIAPEARPDDGVFDVCLVSDLRRIEVLRLIPKLYSGGHVGHPAVTMFRGHEVTADAERAVRCQADGELVGALPARFSIQPGALRCVTGSQAMPSW